MLINYIKIALRNLGKSRLYSFLNVFGLALGIAACLLIALFVGNELSYDRWNPVAERIFRPVADINFGGNHYQLAVSGSVIGPDVAQELPEVQAWCRFRDYGSYLVKRAGAGPTNVREMEVLTVDSSFFTLFPLKVLAGDPATCLTQPNTLAISRSRAEKYFGAPQLAVGQTLMLENRQNWQVTAVYEDMPTTSHFDADLLLAMNGNEEVQADPTLWATNNNFHTYLLLRAGTDPTAFAQKFARLSARKIAITAQEILGTTSEEMAKTGQYAHYTLQNLPDIHLHSDLKAELSPNGNSRYVWVFGAIAAFILLIACINFMNLTTARSAGRVREVGVRKALGSSRPALVGQFLTESVLLAGFAMLLGIGLAWLALPGYRDLTGRDLTMPWGSPLFWGALVAGSGLVGMIAGSYPAFFLSAFQAVRALKGQLHRPGQTATMRSALVVFQFAVSVVLIVSTLLVFRQLNFMQSKKVGFDKSQVIIVEDAHVMGDQVYTFKAEMLRQPAIERGTVSSFLPVSSNRSDQTFSSKRAFEKESSVGMQHWRVDHDYLQTLGMEMAGGRNFDPTRPTDSSAVILNETAAKLFGFTEPFGQKIYVPVEQISGPPKPEDFIELTVIGVVQDFHWASLRDNIGPLCFQ
ncbi:MAG: ABC transporter permease, partial [Saprospiraceae bacterium]|nr:ABC transporter permease [Saprospiraceae bacterium]